MIIQRRKNRKTKGIIKLHRIRRFNPPCWFYWCQCEHGFSTSKTRHISYAIDRMAHPDWWCRQCEDKAIRGMK